MTDKIRADFERFHRDNPEVFRLFSLFTRKMVDRGFEHGSASLVVERIRWETNVETVGGSLKINNNYTAHYARLWENQNPVYEGFFFKREHYNPDEDFI